MSSLENSNVIRKTHNCPWYYIPPPSLDLAPVKHRAYSICKSINFSDTDHSTTDSRNVEMYNDPELE